VILDDEKLSEILQKKSGSRLIDLSHSPESWTVEMFSSIGCGVTIDSSTSGDFVHSCKMFASTIAAHLTFDPRDIENPAELLYSSAGCRHQATSDRNV
jgi:hypothetical protein